MSSRLTRYFQVLCCLGTPDGSSSRPLGSRSGVHACRGAPSVGEAKRDDCPQHPVFRVVECPHSSPPSRRKAKDRLIPVPPVTIADCSPYHDVSSPSRGEIERADYPQLPVFRTFPSPFSTRTPFRLTPSKNRQYNQSSPSPRREAEDQLTPVPLATTTDRPPYHDAPSPSKRETDQIDHSQHPVFQTLPDPSSSRAPFPIPSINRQYNPSLPPPHKKVDGPAGEAEKRMDEIAKMYTTFLPVLHSTWGEDGKSPLLLTVIQTAGAAHVKSREAQEHPRFVIEDVTPLLTREISRSTSDPGYQAQLLAAYLFLLVHPVLQLPTNKQVPCPRLIVVGQAIEEMIYRKDLINDVATWQHLTTYPLTVSAMQAEWIRWSEYESRKRLLWTLYCFDAMQVLYFGGRPAFHVSYFPVPIPAETSVWSAGNAVTWLNTLTSDSQYGQFSERLVGASIIDKLDALQGDWEVPLPLAVWQLTCVVVAIAIELESALYQRHQAETESRYLFDGLPGPTRITLFGKDIPTSIVSTMLLNWIDSYSNCTEIFYEGWERNNSVFDDIIHLWYISHVFLNTYEKPTNEFKYPGTRTANAAKAWLSKSIPKGDKGNFVGTVRVLRFQTMDYAPQEDDC